MRSELLEKINKNKQSTQINLANMQITDDELQELMITIQQKKPNVIIIDLDNNNITDYGAITLKKFLTGIQKIEKLSIQFNDIGREGAIHLFSIKKMVPRLDILFHGNKITNVAEMDEIEQMALI